jgi:hypothetical protein
MKTEIPRPEVTVDVAPSPDGSTVGATIGVSRSDGKGGIESRTYLGGGSNVNEAVKQGVERLLNDRKVGEFLP